MNRAGLQDTILDINKSLKYYTSIAPNCTTCVTFNAGVCAHHGKVPDDFVQEGCEQWEHDDIPF